MKIAVVGLSILSLVLLTAVVLFAAPELALVSNEAPQGYDMGFIDGCIGGVSISYSEGKRPPYPEAYKNCQTLLERTEGAERPLARPPEIQKSHAEELQEQGIEVFRTTWRVP